MLFNNTRQDEARRVSGSYYSKSTQLVNTLYTIQKKTFARSVRSVRAYEVSFVYDCRRAPINLKRAMDDIRYANTFQLSGAQFSWGLYSLCTQYSSTNPPIKYTVWGTLARAATRRRPRDHHLHDASHGFVVSILCGQTTPNATEHYISEAVCHRASGQMHCFQHIMLESVLRPTCGVRMWYWYTCVCVSVCVFRACAAAPRNPTLVPI